MLLLLLSFFKLSTNNCSHDYKNSLLIIRVQLLEKRKHLNIIKNNRKKDTPSSKFYLRYYCFVSFREETVFMITQSL